MYIKDFFRPNDAKNSKKSPHIFTHHLFPSPFSSAPIQQPPYHIPAFTHKREKKKSELNFLSIAKSLDLIYSLWWWIEQVEFMQWCEGYARDIQSHFRRIVLAPFVYNSNKLWTCPVAQHHMKSFKVPSYKNLRDSDIHEGENKIFYSLLLATLSEFMCYILKTFSHSQYESVLSWYKTLSTINIKL